MIPYLFKKLHVSQCSVDNHDIIYLELGSHPKLTGINEYQWGHFVVLT